MGPTSQDMSFARPNEKEEASPQQERLAALLLAEEKLKEQTEVLETINRIGRLLSAELDQQKLVQAVTDAATELCGAQFGSFFYNVYDQQGGSYMLYTLSGVPREAFERFPMPRATHLFGPTFRGEGTIRIDNVKKDPRYGGYAPHHGMPPGHLPVTSYLAVSVTSRSGEVLGGLFFGHSEEGSSPPGTSASSKGSPPRPRSPWTTRGSIRALTARSTSGKPSCTARRRRARKPRSPAGRRTSSWACSPTSCATR